MITVLRDCKGVILADMLPRGEKINSWHNIRMLTKRRKQSGLTRLQQKSYFSMIMQDWTQVLRLKMPPKSLVRQCYSIHPIQPSFFHLFRALKDAICSRKFKTDSNVIHTAKTWLHEQDNSWYQQCSEQNTEGQTLQWPVHFDHYQSFVQLFSLWIQQPQTLNKVQNPADRDAPKSPCFIKWWPRCLHFNVGKASVTKHCKACLHLSHSGLFTSPIFNKCPFKWQCPVSNPVIILSWFLLRLSISHLYS